AIRASASSASSMAPPGLAARGAREEDHALGVRRDVRVLLDHLRLAASAAGVPDGDGGPHPLVQLAPELLDQVLLVLADPRISLGEEYLTVSGLHAQELHEADYVTRLPAGRARFVRSRTGSGEVLRPAQAQGPPPRLFEVVHRAVEVTDPSGEFGVGDLLQYVEDSDELATDHAHIETY